MTQLECVSLRHETPQWSGDYSASFQSGHWHVITGKSGCGKSTFLRLLSGLLTPTDGDILVGGRSVSLLAPHQRGFSFMGQENALFPGVSILENLTLAMHDTLLNHDQKHSKIRELTSLLDLDNNLLRRSPSKLSGGQLSRCNLARALLRPCSWLLLDEPFAAVDRQTRLSILSSLREWQTKTKTGILLVSHDLDDIFTVATDVTIIADGKILENRPLISAIESPIHVSTARLLRAGIVRSIGTRTVFIRQEHLHTNRGTVGCEDRHVETIVMKTPSVTSVGKLLRIIDMDDGTDVTLSVDGEFNGTIWFDKRNVQILAEK